MSEDFIEKIKTDKLSALSALGSLASVAALALVILDKASPPGFPPQLAGWRIIFFVISLFGIGGAGLFTFYWAKSALSIQGRSEHKKALLVTSRCIVGIFITGIFMDALFATMYWQPWLSGLWSLLRYMGLI